MSSDCPVFALSEEQEALREAVRALADDKIAPRAASGLQLVRASRGTSKVSRRFTKLRAAW
jgi:hypothetical protein